MPYPCFFNSAVFALGIVPQRQHPKPCVWDMLSETCRCMTALPAHMQSVGKYLRARMAIFHLSDIIFHTIVSSSVRGSTGALPPVERGRLQECERSIAGRVPARWSPIWWGLEVSCASPVPLTAGAVMSAAVSRCWASLPLGVGQGPASGHTAGFCCMPSSYTMYDSQRTCDLTTHAWATKDERKAVQCCWAESVWPL